MPPQDHIVQCTLTDYRCFGSATISLTPGVQAFVGLNNAGKSALLRSLYELRPYFPTGPGVDITGTSAGHLLSPTGSLLPIHQCSRTTATADTTVQVELIKGWTQCDDAPLARSWKMQIHRRQIDRLSRSIEPGGFGRRSMLKSDRLSRYSATNGEEQVLDVSGLLEALSILGNARYIHAARAMQTGTGQGQQWFDSQTNHAFTSVLRQLQISETKSDIQMFGAIESAVGELLGIYDLRIDAAPERSDILLRYGGNTYRLDELGTGVCQAVFTVFWAAFHRPSYLLIDEPESNLHPLMQSRLVQILSRFAQYGVLFATHSIALARSVADQIWIVQPTASGPSTVVALESPESSAEILGLLGEPAKSTLRIRLIVLVEGPSDVRIVREWLGLLRHDQEILVLPIGGGDLINPRQASLLQDFQRLNLPVAAILDSGRSESGASPVKAVSDFADRCRHLGIRVHITDRREIENYISESARTAAFGAAGSQAFGPFETSARFPGGKANAWRAALHMQTHELLDTDIGKFLEGLTVAHSG